MLYKYNRIKSEVAQYKAIITTQKFSFIFYLPTVDTQRLKFIQSYFQNLGFVSVYINSARSALLINKHLNLNDCLIVSTASLNKLIELPIFLDLSSNHRIFPFAYRVGLNLMTISFFNQWYSSLNKLLIAETDFNLMGSDVQKSFTLVSKFNFLKVFLSFLKMLAKKIY